MEYSKDIGERVRLARIARGLEQHGLAQMAGLSESVISEIERGISGSQEEGILIRIAKALDLPKELFLHKGRIGEQKPRTLEGMLIESGISEEAAGKFVRALRRSAGSEKK